MSCHITCDVTPFDILFSGLNIFYLHPVILSIIIRYTLKQKLVVSFFLYKFKKLAILCYRVVLYIWKILSRKTY